MATTKEVEVVGDSAAGRAADSYASAVLGQKSITTVHHSGGKFKIFVFRAQIKPFLGKHVLASN